MLRFKLLIFTTILITVNSLSSINYIRSQKNVYQESMCVLIDNDGQYDIESFENPGTKYRNVPIEVKAIENRNTRNLITKVENTLKTQSNKIYKTIFYFEFDKLKNLYSMSKDAIFDRFVLESNNSSTFEFDNYYTNQTQVGIFFYNLKYGTTVGWTVYNTSKIIIWHTSKGVKILVTDLRNLTRTEYLPNHVLFYLRILKNTHFLIRDIESTTIALIKECLDVCKLQKLPYKSFDKNFAFYSSYGAEWKDRVLGQPIISSEYYTYDLRRDLSSKYINDSLVYTTYVKGRKNSSEDMDWYKDVFSSPWYYLEFPGYSIQNLVAICNDIEARDCYKTHLEQTYKNETLDSFIILQENQNGKIYLFEKYEDNILILNEIKIPQIKFINASVFNIFIKDFYKMSNQINVVLKDCLINRHILQAFDSLPVALHQNAICIIEVSGIYQIVCEADELTQFVDIKVSYKLNNTNEVIFKELTSSLVGRFQAVIDTINTNYFIFEKYDIYDFIHVGLGAHNAYIAIIQNKKINMNFELFNLDSNSTIEFSTIDIHTAHLEIISISLSNKKPKVRLTMSKSIIGIETFQVGYDAEQYHDKILYRISYKTDEVKAELMSHDYSYDLIAKTICH